MRGRVSDGFGLKNVSGMREGILTCNLFVKETCVLCNGVGQTKRLGARFSAD